MLIPLQYSKLKLNKLRLIFTILILTVATNSFAQFNQGLYISENLPLHRLINPSAEFSGEKEILLPFISHIDVQSQLYGFTLQEIYSNENANTTLERFIETKTGKEHAWVSNKINLAYIGFADYTNTKFWSFGIYQESQSYTFYPKDLVDIAYYGNANNFDRKYQVNDIKAKSNAMMVYHVGLTFAPKHKKYTFGGRIKIYNSFLTLDASRNNGNISTVVNSINKADIILDGSFNANASGINTFTNSSYAEIVKKIFYSGNLGLGFDIGGTYYINRDWIISGSLLDLGAIYSSNDVQGYSIKGFHDFEGTVIKDPNSTSTDFWEKMINDFNANIVAKENRDNFVTTLTPKLIGSISYNFSKNKKLYSKNKRTPKVKNNSCNYNNWNHTIKLTSYNRLLRNYWDWALGVSYYGKLNNWFAVQTNYLYSPYDPTNIGLGVSFNIKTVLFYISVDNIPGLLNLNKANSAGAMIGINFII